MLTKIRIQKELEKILPKENILTTKEECYVYAQDGTNDITSDNLPSAVVFPEKIEQVQKILRYANANKIPITTRGSGTNLVGACITEHGGIVVNLTKMNKILEINETNMTARVEAGVVVGDLQQAVESKKLFFPPDPSNLRVSTIGGAIAQSAGGPKTYKYGTTKDYVLGLKIVLADGSIINTGTNTIKNATGYHLEQLFVGSEGTLGIVVEAVLKLIPKPETTRVILAYFNDIEYATKSVNAMSDANIRPSTIDFMDRNTINTVEKFYPANLLTDKEAALIIEIDGFEISMDEQIRRIKEILTKTNATDIIISENDEDKERIWTSRRSSFAACAKLKPDVLSNDLIVPRENISKLVKGINEIGKKYNLCTAIVGHIGDGNIHPHIIVDLNNETERKNSQKAKDEFYSLTLELGGTLSAEHGIGMEKRKYIEQAIDENTLKYMKEIKKIFDKNNILNSDKIFHT